MEGLVTPAYVASYSGDSIILKRIIVQGQLSKKILKTPSQQLLAG
jgi:hypothetical protein